MTTFILGGTGFIGRRVVRLLAGAGERLVCMGPRVSPACFTGVEHNVLCIRGDATRFDDVVAAMTTAKPVRVLNLCYLHGSDNDPHTAFARNVQAMDNVLEAARRTDVKRVVFASSLGVHGPQTNHGSQPITETAPLEGIGTYSRQKIFNEWQAQDYAEKHDMSIIAVRPANVSGFDKVLGSVDHVRLISEPARNRQVEFSYADFMRLVIDVEDVAEAFRSVLFAEEPRHNVYHTGGHTTSLGRLADLVRLAIPDADIRFASETGGIDLSLVHLVDNSRLTNEFGFRLRPLGDTIARVISEVRRCG